MTRPSMRAHQTGSVDVSPANKGGKPAHYVMLRWVISRGETGPWSETASATVPA